MMASSRTGSVASAVRARGASSRARLARSSRPTHASAHTPTAAAAATATEPVKVWEGSVGDSDEGGHITADVTRAAAEDGEEAYTLNIHLDQSLAPGREGVLHWAVDDWGLPPQGSWPAGTNQVDEKAVQSPISDRSVTIAFPPGEAPTKMVFVMRMTGGGEEERWHNNGNCFTIAVRAPSASDVVLKVYDAESNWETYTLMQRLMLALEIVTMAERTDDSGTMGFVYSWLRLSAMKLLPWYKGGNYQPKDMAHVQKTLMQKLADLARNADTRPMDRVLARLTAANLSRGGGDPEQIRLEILAIFRRHNIKEGHRPGIEDEFLRQWHQKLHSNTTVEDIPICEAYLHFLRGWGDSNDFYWHLNEYSDITPERLSEMVCGWRSNGITSPPQHHDQGMIGSFEHYLWILKGVHAGSDIDTMAVMCQGHLDGDLNYQIQDLLANRDEWWVPGKVVEIREMLAGYRESGAGGRDILLLDIALEKFGRLSLERSNLTGLSGDDLVSTIELVLRGTCVSGLDATPELHQTLNLWRSVVERKNNGDLWSPDGAQVAYAASENVRLALASHMDTFYSLVQKPAEDLGKMADIGEEYTRNFGEEAVRGQPLFLLSQLLQLLQPSLREAAGLPPFQAVSTVAGEVAGRVVGQNLEDIQGQTFDKEPVILLTGQVGGLEDIPPGIVAVICDGSVDVLSHVAIRARNQGVLLVSCADSASLEPLRSLVGEFASVGLTPDGTLSAAKTAPGADPAPAAAPAPAPAAAPAAAAPAAAAPKKAKAPAKKAKASAKKAKAPAPAPEAPAPAAAAPAPAPEAAAPVALRARESSEWVLTDEAFTTEVVGGKSLHLHELRTALAGAGSSLAVPSSIALPFGVFERVLDDPENEAAAAEMKPLMETLANAGAESDFEEMKEKLEAMRGAVSKLRVPPALREVLEPICAASDGLSDAPFDDVWAGVLSVWASQWSDRAWLNRNAMKLKHEDLRMACLLQPVIPADFAFVLHTVNPVTGNADEMLGEVVVGLGETLVSNTPGDPLSFTCARDGSDMRFLTLPSKRTALYPTDPANAVIARSDSNAEDLEDFAGAGLYDSVLLGPGTTEVVLDYSKANSPAHRLLNDANFRGQLAKTLAVTGVVVESALGTGPQDIEGVVAGGRVHIVQARPQIVN